jgi:GTP-binding protein YchF
MIVGLIGLGLSGKTTVFNAVTRGDAEVGSFQSQKGAFHRGRVLVPDARVDWLTEMSKSANVVYAEVEYLDVAGFSGEKESASESEIPQILRESEALAHVVRGFANAGVIHPKGTIDIRRDIAALDEELVFTDLILVEKRLDRVERQSKVVKDDKVRHEAEVLRKVRQTLEQNIPLRSVTLPPEEEKLIRGFRFLSEKPMLIIINIGEEDIDKIDTITAEYADLKDKPNIDLAVICGKIEMELAQLSDEDQQTFMADMGLKESALDIVIRKSYSLLGLISFLTTGDKETRAWTIKKGSTAQSAAGAIHADFERGFIRAEIVAYGDLKKTGSYAEARKHGVVRLEGKSYIVQDGDVVIFRFNV